MCSRPWRVARSNTREVECLDPSHQVGSPGWYHVQTHRLASNQCVHLVVATQYELILHALWIYDDYAPECVTYSPHSSWWRGGGCQCQYSISGNYLDLINEQG